MFIVVLLVYVSNSIARLVGKTYQGHHFVSLVAPCSRSVHWPSARNVTNAPDAPNAPNAPNAPVGSIGDTGDNAPQCPQCSQCLQSPKSQIHLNPPNPPYPPNTPNRKYPLEWVGGLQTNPPIFTNYIM